MTRRRRFILAVTVLSFLTVTGFVVGCDSDDGPKVTAPAPAPAPTATRNMTAEEQGRDGLEETDNGSMVRNKGTAALNVRFNYDEARHYRLNPETSMPSDPANAGSAPTRVACGVPATGRANGQCFTNDGVTAPVPYEPPSDPGSDPPSDPGSNPPSDPGSDPPSDPGSDPPSDPGSGGGGSRTVWHPSQAAAACVQRTFRSGSYYSSREGRVLRDVPRAYLTISNTCGKRIEIAQACSVETPILSDTIGGRTWYRFGSFGAPDLAPGTSQGVVQQTSCRDKGGDMVFVACYSPYSPYILSPSVSGRISYDCYRL